MLDNRIWPKGGEPPGPVDKRALFSSLPPEWLAQGLLEQIRAGLKRAGRKLVVLDDDPLGTQATHGVLVATAWDEDTLSAALQAEGEIFYLITNSRSLSQERAAELYCTIARRLYRLGHSLGRDFTLLCRSDSTLRGHFPAEVEALSAVREAELGRSYDGVILAPFMWEGRRFTIGDVQWVEDRGRLVPAGQSEYARDPIFAYRHSNLPLWIEEKHKGQVQAREVATISLEDIRRGGPERVAALLGEVRDGRPVVLNAASYRDLEVAVAGLTRAEEAGKHFLSWTAASFIRVRSGRAARPLLTPEEIYCQHPRPGRGLIIVGSYVERSTRQVERARRLSQLAALELEVERVLEPTSRQREVARARRLAQEAFTKGDLLIYTSRRPVSAANWEESLRIGEEICTGLVEVVRALRPEDGLRFMAVKGGATAHAIVTQGLGVKMAWALGQIQPGVPLWLLGEGSRYPGLPYVVFPGNVGDDDTLAQVILTLREGSLARPENSCMIRNGTQDIPICAAGCDPDAGTSTTGR